MAKHFERKDYKNVTKAELEIAPAASDSCDDVRTTELFDRLMQKENSYGGKRSIDRMEHIVMHFLCDILVAIVSGMNYDLPGYKY